MISISFCAGATQLFRPARPTRSESGGDGCDAGETLRKASSAYRTLAWALRTASSGWRVPPSPGSRLSCEAFRGRALLGRQLPHRRTIGRARCDCVDQIAMAVGIRPDDAPKPDRRYCEIGVPLRNCATG
jgi:hypothetical protein